jgi:iron complex transport system ATP-binding protein
LCAVDRPSLATRLEDVSVVLNGRQVLGPITWSVAVGEHWALLGPNGSGKTTVLSLLGAERHPSSGRATVLGEVLGRTDVRELRKRIGVLGHRVSDRIPGSASALDVVLTGKEALLDARWGKFGRADKVKAMASLASVGCEHVARQSFSQCSQGERQRVLLARSLYGEHELFLLDEPAVGVDFPGREALIKVLDSLSHNGAITTIHVVHALEELPASTTHAALLRDGQMMAAGLVQDVLSPALLQECFGMSFVVSGSQGRRSARAAD